MGGEFSSNPDLVAAELAWLDDLLADVEDWRALQQLEARQARGEDLTSINGQSLKAALLSSLSQSRFFKRRQAVEAELARLISARDSGTAAPVSVSHITGLATDDLSRIRGVTPLMMRRLNALDVTTFDQVAKWTAADVQYISKLLGAGRAISGENWIEQAALLARQRPEPPLPPPPDEPEANATTGSTASKELVSESATAPAEAQSAGLVQADPPLAGVPPRQSTSLSNEVSAVPAQEDTPPEEDWASAVQPAGPLPAWRYAPHQKTPMMIADMLAALGQLHRSVVDESQIQDRLAERLEDDEELSREPHDFGLLSPAMPLPASEYRGQYGVSAAAPEPELEARSEPQPEPETVPPAVAAALQPEAIAVPVAIEPVTLRHPALPLPAAAYASSHFRPSIEVAEPSPPAPTVRQAIEVPNAPLQPSPTSTNIVFDVATQQALAHAVAKATAPAPRVAPQSDPIWNEGAERNIRNLEQLLATPMDGEKLAARVAPQARVTIRRAEEAMSAAPRHVPNIFTRRAPEPKKPSHSNGFDAANYAGYQQQIEEASVDIVRKPVAEDVPPEGDPPGRGRRHSAWLTRAMGRLLKVLARQ
jgi:predicted flap endonuclease-1-like 5' DNA nuclease